MQRKKFKKIILIVTINEERDLKLSFSYKREWLFAKC